MTSFFFYVLTACMVITSIGVVTARNILHAALFLIATFYGTVVLYLMMKAEFVALTQLVVYIGGIVIVVVFTILLTSRLGEAYESTTRLRKFFSGLLAASFLAMFGKLVLDHRDLFAGRTGTAEEFASLDIMGQRLLSASASGFLLPFEIISVLLLTAIVGAMVIAERADESKDGEGPKP